jgi:glycosyltransferase involved in cell wall biosynthesis
VWDQRKFRDVLLGALEPVLFRGSNVFEKRGGLTLGVVSLLSPIKQLPLLFSILAPRLARHDVNVEVFGAGGYAQVRDVRRALAPLGQRARFWGHQDNVAAVYRRLDYLMTGLPEKEALGLNVLEAQACGTPVLAPNAPPFTETVLDGKTGLLYVDPRIDGGADFEKRLTSPRPDPRSATEHLAQFTYEALVDRARRLVKHLESGSGTDFLQTKMPA